MEETRLVKDQDERDDYEPYKKTMVKSLLELYNISYPRIAKVYNDDARKYASLIDGDYQRIDKNVLKNLCEYLNVSTDLVLDGICKNMEPKVYISNINKWFTFDEYIMFRSIRGIYDFMDDYGHKLPVIHEFSKTECSWLDLNRNDYIEQLKEKMKEGSITIYIIYNRPLRMDTMKYKISRRNIEQLTKRTFMKYIDEETFNNCLRSTQIKKITEKLSIDIDLDKNSYTQDELMQILNACLEQNQKNNNDTVDNNSKDDELVKDDPSESNQDTADNNDDSDK